MSAMSRATSMLEVARSAAPMAAQAEGAQEAAAAPARVRDVERAVARRQAREDQRGDHPRPRRCSSTSTAATPRSRTSDLRPEALDTLHRRRGGADPHAGAGSVPRAARSGALRRARPSVDLQLEDPALRRRVDAATRRRELAAGSSRRRRAAVQGAERILSVTTGVRRHALARACRVHSNGFEGARRDTAFWISARGQREGPRRPPARGLGRGRRAASSPSCRRRPRSGRGAAERALARLGAKKGDVGGADDGAREPRRRPARWARSSARSPARPLQQKRSFLEGKLGQAIGSPLLDLADDPLLPRASARASSTARGIAARRCPVFEEGVLRNFYVDTYYGKKLEMAPTTGGASNLVWALGRRGPRRAARRREARASSSPASWAATPTAPPATSRSASRASASAAGSSPSRSAR